MLRTPMRAATAGMALIAGLGFVGCAAEGNTDEPGYPNTAAGAGGEAGGGADNAGAEEEGGAAERNSSGGMATLNTNPQGDGGVPDESCAARVSQAETVPLDMYIMLDVSGSMLEPTSSYDKAGLPISKWLGIKTALQAFIEDEGSHGIGVGIQYFPLIKADVPSSCSSDADCGDSAPCQFHFCSSSGISCTKNADCGTSVFNTCVEAGQCGDLLCEAGSTCLINNAAVACTKLTTSTCQHIAKCDLASYAEPAVPIAPLPDSGPALLASLEAQVIDPVNPTPTGPALSGALAAAKTWAQAHPTHRVVAVLATDGVANECTPLETADLGRLAEAALGGKPSISTFTIGVFPTAALAKGQFVLNTIASAGGSKQAFVIDTSHDLTVEFRAALDAVRSTQLACEFEIPAPEQSEQVNYSLVNVNFKTGKKSSTLPYVQDAAGCDPLSGGWYYDTDPEVEDPTRIVVCPTTCATFESASNATVEIAVGCKTIVK
ncbi:MAG TPA: VWA domain-containing protein [Polyangiaceae bacterium]|jgi:hypothetical protein